MSEFMKVSEAARILDVSVRTMYVYCAKEGFPAIRLPSGKVTGWKINRAGFSQWLKDRSV